MLNPSIRFCGLTDNISPDPRKQKKNGIPIYTFTPDGGIKDACPCYKGYSVILGDNTSAYLHPKESNHSKRIGAQILSDLLHFDIVPITRAIQMPNELPNIGTIDASEIGTLCEWINGYNAEDYLRTNQDKIVFDPTKSNIIKLYTFFLISMEGDSHGRNIMMQDTVNGITRFFAIDNEKCGTKERKFINSIYKFPKPFRELAEGKPLPEDILKKLQSFLSERETRQAELSPYFNDYQINSFYRIAQALLKLKKIPTESELTKLYGINQVA